MSTIINKLECKTATTSTGAKLRTDSGLSVQKNILPLTSNKNNESNIKVSESNVTQEMVEAKQKSIIQRCTEYNISNENIQNYMLKKLHMTPMDFEKLSLNKKYEFLLIIEEAVEKQIVYLKEKNGKIKKEVDAEAVIGNTAHNIKIAKDTGMKKEFDKITKNNDKLIEYKKCKTKNEQRKFLMQYKEQAIKDLDAKRDKDLALCGNNEAKKADIIARYNSAKEAILNQCQTDYIAQCDVDDINQSVYLQEGTNYSKAVTTSMELTAPEYQTQVADSFTYEFQMQVLKDFYEAGDAISAEEYGKAVETTTSYMSKDALEQFQDDAKNFDASDAPYLTQEHKNAQRAAIERGAASNSNISTGYSSQKAGVNENVTIGINTNLYNTNPEKINSNRAKSQQIKQSEQTLTSLKNIESQLYVTNSLNKVIENNPNNKTDIIELVLRDRKYHVHLDDAIKELRGFSPEQKGDMIAKCSYTVIGKVLYEYPSQCRRIMDRVDKSATHDKRFLGNKKVQEITGEKIA